MGLGDWEFLLNFAGRRRASRAVLALCASFAPLALVWALRFRRASRAVLALRAGFAPAALVWAICAG